MMKTKVNREGDLTIIELSGYLDFENANPLAESIGSIYSANPASRIVINLVGLEFVGSSGISAFVKTLRNYNRAEIKPTYFGVKSEFQRLFRLFEEEDPFEIVQDEHEAKALAQVKLRRIRQAV